MSNILEMLRKSKGEIADLVRPLVEGEPEAPRYTPILDGAGAMLVEAQAGTLPGKDLTLAAVRTLSIQIEPASPLMPFDDSQWRPSEQYRILRTKISHHPKQPQVIVVSSPAPGDGKSVSAINTAGALSLKSEGKVLLMDADLRKSAIPHQLGLPESPGLADLLTGACKLDDAIIHIREFPNLFVLPGGVAPGNPTELLDSAAWTALCGKLRNLFRYVILDSPPVGAVADYDLIQAVCDGVILVVRPDHTNRGLCMKALEHLPKEKLLGVIMNCVPDWAPGKAAGSDYYYYSSEKHYQTKGVSA